MKTRLIFTALTLAGFLLGGCNVDTGITPQDTSVQATAATSRVNVTVNFPAADPTNSRGLANAVKLQLRVLARDSGNELTPLTELDRSAGVSTLTTTLANLPTVPLRVHITGLNEVGDKVGVSEQTVTPSDAANLTFDSLFDTGPTREIGLVSLSTLGVQTIDQSFTPSISADGRFVIFASNSVELGATSTLTFALILRDRLNGTTTRVDNGPSGDKGDPTLAPDGKSFAYFRQKAGDGLKGGDMFYATTVSDLGGSQLVHTLINGTVNGLDLVKTTAPRLSNNGKLVFLANEPIVAGQSNEQVIVATINPNNPAQFSLEMVSSNNGVVGNGRSNSASITADGNFVLFRSTATNLGGDSTRPYILKNLQDGTSIRVGLAGSAAMSPSGRFLAGASGDDLKIIDRQNNTQNIIPLAAPNSIPSVSDDGQVAFSSARALLPCDINSLTDLYHFHPVGGLSRVNVSPFGNSVQGGFDIGLLTAAYQISADGSRIAFSSRDSRLVPNDIDTVSDVFTANAPKPGKLYVATDTGILRFANATNLNGNPTPEATITGSNTRLNQPVSMSLDTANDRLFVATAAEILVFDNISSKNGNIAPNRRYSNAALVSSIKQISYDPVRDKLYALTNGGNNLRRIDTPSTLNGGVPIEKVSTLFTQIAFLVTPALGSFTPDILRDSIYLGDPGRIRLLSPASTGSAPTVKSTISGALTNLPNGFSLRLDGSPVQNTDTAIVSERLLVTPNAASNLLAFGSLGSGGNLTPISNVAMDPVANETTTDPNTGNLYRGRLGSRTISVFFRADGAGPTNLLRSFTIPNTTGNFRAMALDRTR